MFVFLPLDLGFYNCLQETQRIHLCLGHVSRL